MFKSLHFKSLLLMLCMTLGAGQMWAQKVTLDCPQVVGQPHQRVSLMGMVTPLLSQHQQLIILTPKAI